MTRHFLANDAQERYTQARFDAIRTLGRIAKEEQCDCMLVCGDAFESNQVDRKTVARALEALKDVPVPVYLLPGNHDPLNAASVYRSSTFLDRKPAQVQVIETGEPIVLRDGVEIIGAPWLSKRPAMNPLEELLASLAPAEAVIRICMGHGILDQFTPDKDAPGVISTVTLERAIIEGKAHFIALGDRHSLTKIGSGGDVWYAGTPEATDFSETQSGYAQIVEIAGGQVTTKPVQVGQWRFIERVRVDLNSSEDIETLRTFLDGIERKELSVVRLNLVGSLPFSLAERLQNHLAVATDVFGALVVRDEELLVLPDDTDFAELGFSGFADMTVKRLREHMDQGGDKGATARDALMLMLRLARGAV
jgi:DNA repair exonuclease SbcCD nuclease subunit